MNLRIANSLNVNLSTVDGKESLAKGNCIYIIVNHIDRLINEVFSLSKIVARKWRSYWGSDSITRVKTTQGFLKRRLSQQSVVG